MRQLTGQMGLGTCDKGTLRQKEKGKLKRTKGQRQRTKNKVTEEN